MSLWFEYSLLLASLTLTQLLIILAILCYMVRNIASTYKKMDILILYNNKLHIFCMKCHRLTVQSKHSTMLRDGRDRSAGAADGGGLTGHHRPLYQHRPVP